MLVEIYAGKACLQNVACTPGFFARCITVGHVIDSVCKNEYNWLAGKSAGTVKHKKTSERVN